jgi:hypothetical protein
MPTTSFAVVTLRILSILISTSGALMIISSIGLNLYMRSMMNQFGVPDSVNGAIMGNSFQASSIGSLFSIQFFISLLVVFGGAALYSLSNLIGRFITKDLP